MKKILIIIKKIFNKNYRCKITLFAYTFFSLKHYSNNILYTQKFYKFYNFNSICSIQHIYLYTTYINRTNWLNFILSIIKINPNVDLLIIFQNKEEVRTILKGRIVIFNYSTDF